MKPTTLVAAAVTAAVLSAAAEGADVYPCTITPDSSTASFSMNASAPFAGTMVGDTTATPPTRTKTGTLAFFPLPPHANCTAFGATQNDPLNISGTMAASGSGSNIHPSGTFTLGIDTVAGTSSITGATLNLLGGSTASVAANLNNFTYPTFCTINPTCGVPFLVAISLPVGSLTVTSMTAVQDPGTANGSLTAAAGGGYDFAIPVTLTVTADANFAGSPFPLEPQSVPVVLTGHVDISGDTATVTSSLMLDLSPPGVTTPTPFPPTPFTIPPGTGLCDGANLILSLTINSSTVSVTADSDLVASGTRAACPCDWNHSGAISVQDIFDFLASYFGGAGDFNGQGGSTVQDIFDFLACYFGRPLPC